MPVEGCFCLPGFVLDNDGSCIAPTGCGCPLPDLSAIISVYKKLMHKFLREIDETLIKITSGWPKSNK